MIRTTPHVPFRVIIVTLTFTIVFEDVILFLINYIGCNRRAVSKVFYDIVYWRPMTEHRCTLLAKMSTPIILFGTGRMTNRWVFRWDVYCDLNFKQGTIFYLFP